MGTTPQSRGDRGMIQFVDLLEFAIEQANDGIAIMRFTGDPEVPIRIVYANATIERLSGFTRAELLDPSNPLLRVQPQNRARYEALFDQVRAGKAVRFEIALGGKDRSTWCEIRWSPLQYAGKEVTHYVAVLREHPVEQAREPIAILEFDEGGGSRPRVAFVNDAMCELLKLSRDHIFAHGLGEITHLVQPGAFEQEVLLRRGDGTTAWVAVEGTPAYGELADVVRVTLACRDIDERKRRDEEVKLLESVLSQTSDFVLVTDALRPSENGPKITYANPAFAAVVGLRAEQVGGKALTGFVAASKDENAVTSMLARLERHLAISLELQLRNVRSGNDVWIELSGQPVRDENGRAVSWIFIGKDISLRKQTYVQTAQLLTALDLADEPIAIYHVVRPFVLEKQHGNRVTEQYGQPLIQSAFADPDARKRFESAWQALEQGEHVKRLIYAGEDDARRWVTLEVRPMNSARHALNTLIAIEHPVGSEASDEIGLMLALSREILGFNDLAARVDGFLEVLRREWGITATFSTAKRDLDLVIRAKEHTGYMVVPAGVLFRRPVAVDFSWNEILPPRRLTALRIFLETLSRAD